MRQIHVQSTTRSYNPLSLSSNSCIPSIMMTTSNKPRLLSIANAIAYGASASVTFGWPFVSGKTNADLSKSYQTLITPNAAAFSIWGLIFLAQAVFVVSTLASKRLMTHPLVVDGVGFKYVLVCLAQALWTPVFGHEMMGLSAALLGCILMGLLAIIKSQYATVSKIVERETSDPSALLTWKTYWLLQFPFEEHAGWVVAAFALGINVLVVSLGGSARAQVIVAAVSLVVLAITSAVWLALERPLFTLPLVAAWATVSEPFHSIHNVVRHLF